MTKKGGKEKQKWQAAMDTLEKRLTNTMNESMNEMCTKLISNMEKMNEGVKGLVLKEVSDLKKEMM